MSITKELFTCFTTQQGNTLKWPIKQNKGGLSVFGTALSDSIKASHLPDTDKLRLKGNVEKTVKAINSLHRRFEGYYCR
jgi:hypothetical protein